MTTITARDRILKLPAGSRFHFAPDPERLFEVIEKGDEVRESGRRSQDLSLVGNGTFSSWAAGDLVIDSHAQYDPSMLLMFKLLAEEAIRRGYCEEYDAIASVVGAPSRDEIKSLTAKTWRVSVPILTHVEITVQADSEEEAIHLSNNTVYRRVFLEQRSSLEAENWGFYNEPDKTFSARITAKAVE